MSSPSCFRRGFIDAAPICFGYAGVGFAVAAAAVANGHPVWSPVVQSLTQLSGTSQGALSHRAIPGPDGGFWALAALCLCLNARYLLLSLALAQKLPPGIGPLKRAAIALSVTDENAALAVSRPFAPGPSYLAGVFASSYLGWNIGNAAGAAGTSLLPPNYVAPLGIALYAMFVAIVTGAAKASRPMLFAVAAAALANTALRAIVPLASRAPALAVLASGIAAAALSVWLFPSTEDRR